MKTSLFFLLTIALSLCSVASYAQKQEQTTADTALLGLPGDNLDLYAVLELFQKSKTIEDFEKALNEEKTGINNLDLNLDNKVDFIKVVTKKDGDNFTFILQVDVSKTEVQDVAVILVSKDKNKKVTMQIVGDKALYGEGYIVEPKKKTPASTPNPGYTGPEPVKEATASTTTVVVVESAPIVQYVYSPAYVPYVPPYYYGYYPPYFAAFTVMAVGVYRHACWGYHGGYGYHGNTTVIHNTNVYNNYNVSRNSSNTVNHNKANGSYNRNNASTRPAGGTTPTTRPANPSASDRQSKPSTGNRQSNPSVSDRQSKPSTGNKQSNPSVSDRQSNTSSGNRQSSPSVSDRQSSSSPSRGQSGSSVSNRQSGPSSSGSYGDRGGSGSRGGGSYSSGGRSSGYSGGGRSGGGSRGGGGGRGGRR